MRFLEVCAVLRRGVVALVLLCGIWQGLALADTPRRVLVNGYEQFSEATCILLQQEHDRLAGNAAQQRRAARTMALHCQQPQPYQPPQYQDLPSSTLADGVLQQAQQDFVAERAAARSHVTPVTEVAAPAGSTLLQRAFTDAAWQAWGHVKASYQLHSAWFQLLFGLFAVLLILKVLASKLLFGSAVWIGRKAEKYLAKRLKQQLSPEFEHYHNLVLPTEQGDLTELDHLVLSPYGLFVIEVKNHQGWVFGQRDQLQWTVQHFRRKHRINNPLRQNYKHIKALQYVLHQLSHKVAPEQLHSIVAFSNRAQFKSEFPSNVMHLQDVDSYICQRIDALNPAFSDAQLAHIRVLLDNFAAQAPQLRKLHLQQVNIATDL